MSENRTPGHNRRLKKARTLSLAGIATAGAAALALSLGPAGAAQGATVIAAAPAGWTQDLDGARTHALQQRLDVQQALLSRHSKDAAWKHRDGTKAASRSAARAPIYANDLSGWIKESLAVMKEHGIPGTYSGLYKNIMRESSGNPSATNNWDVNAQDGDPSIGLLQVIRPTFLAYHVPGTAESQYNPVANIAAAANYAAARYGSIDNVHGAY